MFVLPAIRRAGDGRCRRRVATTVQSGRCGTAIGIIKIKREIAHCRFHLFLDAEDGRRKEQELEQEQAEAE